MNQSLIEFRKEKKEKIKSSNLLSKKIYKSWISQKS